MATKKPETKVEKIEREYVIPLREKCRPVARYKKTNKAVKSIKEFLARHMKVRDRDLKKIKLDRYLNEVVWARGIKKPPVKIKVKAVKEGDIVRAELVDIPAKLKFKKAREEKIEKKSLEIMESKKKTLEKMKESVSKSKEEKKPEEESSKVDEKEKKAAVAESGAKMEKAAAKQTKHQVGGKTKQSKAQVRKVLDR